MPTTAGNGTTWDTTMRFEDIVELSMARRKRAVLRGEHTQFDTAQVDQIVKKN